MAANPPGGYDPETFLHLDQDARFALQLNWQKQLHSAGWVGVHWPKAYGGRGATVMEQTIYCQEMVRARLPEVANFMGIRIVGPTLSQNALEPVEVVLHPPTQTVLRFFPTVERGRLHQLDGMVR